jgi:integrase
MLFSELVKRYGKHASVRLQPRTWLNRRSLLRTLEGPFGAERLERIDEDLVDSYVEQRLEDGLQPVSVNNELRVLRRVLHFGQERRHYRGELRIELLAEDEPRVKFWTPAEVSRLFHRVRRYAPPLLPIVVTIANTGCRRGEALALEWPRVNFRRGLLEFWPSRHWRPKSRKPREVPMSDELCALLERLPRSSPRWVFPCNTGERWAYWPQLQFDRAREAAGLVGGPHTLRHTFASLFLSRCADLPLLAQILGHSDERVTRLYAHLLPDHLERARNVVQFAPPLRHRRRGSIRRTDTLFSLVAAGIRMLLDRLE